MANISRRIHYIPEFYLRAFCNQQTNKLFQYAKVHGGRIIESLVTPRSTGFLKDSTLFTSGKYDEQVMPDHLEKSGYSVIDQQGADSLSRQLNEGVDKLNSVDKEAWAEFLNSLLERSPEAVHHLTRVVENSYNEALEKIRESRILSGDQNPDEFLATLRSNDILAGAKDTSKIQHFEYMVGHDFIRSIVSAPLWINTEIQSEEFLITSDYPVHLMRDEATKKILGMQIALTPKIMQSIYFPSDATIDFHKQHVPQFIQYHNLMQIQDRPNFVYSDRKLDNTTNIRYLRAMELFLDITDPSHPS